MNKHLKTSLQILAINLVAIFIANGRDYIQKKNREKQERMGLPNDNFILSENDYMVLNFLNQKKGTGKIYSEGSSLFIDLEADLNFRMGESIKKDGEVKHVLLTRHVLNEDNYYLGDMGKWILLIYEPSYEEKQKYYEKGIVKKGYNIFSFSLWNKDYFQDLIHKWSRRIYLLDCYYNTMANTEIFVESSALGDEVKIDNH